MFASAYMGRKRRAQPYDRFSLPGKIWFPGFVAAMTHTPRTRTFEVSPEGTTETYPGLRRSLFPAVPTGLGRPQEPTPGLASWAKFSKVQPSLWDSVPNSWFSHPLKQVPTYTCVLIESVAPHASASTRLLRPVAIYCDYPPKSSQNLHPDGGAGAIESCEKKEKILPGTTPQNRAKGASAPR
jgi:hypothetical protein